MRVLLIRHGPWAWQPATNEADFPLAPQTKALARTVRRAIRRAGLRPDAYLTSRWRHARDTAIILRGRDADPALVDVIGLTPKTAERRFTWRGILDEAVAQGVHITDASTLAFVGHEPRLRQLCTRVARVDVAEIERLEVVVVHATSLKALLGRHAQVERHILVRPLRRRNAKPATAR